jgi:hypothetical protein
MRGKLVDRNRDDDDEDRNLAFKPMTRKSTCAILAYKNDLYQKNHMMIEKVTLVR